MIQQAEILKNDAYASAQTRDLSGKKIIRHPTKKIDKAACRLKSQQHEPQQSCLARSRRSGQKLKRLRLNLKRNVPENFWAHPVTQADIFESNQAVLFVLP
jgi:hypothetical protein